MKASALIAATLLCLAAAFTATRAADEPSAPPPAVEGPLSAVAPFVGGEWHIDGKWANGEALKAREVFEWGLANKFVTSRTFITRNDGTGEYERYRGVFAVRDGKLVSYNFAYDGANTVDDVTVDGKVIKIKREVTTPAPMVIRQEIELVTAEKFRWRVFLERDGQTNQIMDGEWVRRKGEAAEKKTEKL